MDPSVFFEAVATLGLTSALVVFFVWISWKREERLAARITELETHYTEIVLVALRDSTKAMHDISSALVDVRQDIHKIEHNLECRPCAINERLNRANDD